MSNMTEYELQHSLKLRGYQSSVIFLHSRHGSVTWYLSKDWLFIFRAMFGVEFASVVDKCKSDLDAEKCATPDTDLYRFCMINWIRQRRYLRHGISLVPPKMDGVESPHALNS